MFEVVIKCLNSSATGQRAHSVAGCRVTLACMQTCWYCRSQTETASVSRPANSSTFNSTLFTGKASEQKCLLRSSSILRMLTLNSTAFNVWQIESDRSIKNPRQFLQCLCCSAVFSVWLNEEIYQGVFRV